MDETPLQLVFNGELLPGFAADVVRQALSQRARLDAERLDTMFSGRRVVIKRDLNAVQAAKWVRQFEAMGARLQVEDMPRPSGTSTAAEDRPLYSLATRPFLPTAAPGADPLPARTPSLPNPRSRHGVREVLRARRHALPELQSPDAPLFGLSFRGRIGRVRNLLGGLLALTGLVWLLLLVTAVPGTDMLWLLLLGTVTITAWACRLMVLRLHDLNGSGWWALIALLPGVGIVAGLALSLLPGSPYDNDHGAPPQDDGVTPLAVAGVVLCLGLFGVVRLTTASYERYLSQVDGSTVPMPTGAPDTAAR